MPDHRERLEYLRAALRAESISYGELAELQGLTGFIEPDDVELLEAAGVPEETWREQQARRARLAELVDVHHREHYGDYSDAFAEFAATYGLAPREDGDELLPIPRYASVAEDETYGMLHLCDTAAEAIADQAGVPSNGDTLNVPGGIVDLDTGERVEYVLVGLESSALAEAKAEVKAALEGDSNDAEHDALVTVAELLGIDA